MQGLQSGHDHAAALGRFNSRRFPRVKPGRRSAKALCIASASVAAIVLLDVGPGDVALSFEPREIGVDLALADRQKWGIVRVARDAPSPR